MDRQLVTKEQMRLIERYAINYLGVPEIALMENAANSVIKNIDLFRRETFAIICGVGNNGADGLVIARNLLAYGKTVYVFIIGDIEKATELFSMNYKILKNIDADIYTLETIGDFEDFEKHLDKVNTIIDAMVGTGFEGSFLGVYDYVIETINRSRIYTISVDMPSGMDADTGLVNSVCVIPDLIVTFQFMKVGLTKSTKLIATKVVVENIGIPLKAVRRVIAERPKF